MPARPVAAGVALLLLALALPPAAGATTPGANGLIAFTACPQDRPNAPACGQEVWTIAADGSGKRPVTSMFYGATSARWTPDGQTLAFDTERLDILSAPLSVFATRVVGNGTYAQTMEGVRTVAERNAFVFASVPSWAPDGDAYVIAQDDGPGGSEPPGITLVAAHGFTRPLVEDDVDGPALVSTSEPMWSPDGTRVAFLQRTSDDGGTTWSLPTILTIDPDHPGATPEVLDVPTHAAQDLDWAPDGRRLIYATGRPGATPAPAGIWTVNADGTGTQQLTPDGYAPVFSPDGTQVVFARADGLYVMPAAGGAAQRIHAGPSDHPDWQAVAPPPPSGPAGPQGPAGGPGPAGPAGAPGATVVRSSSAPTPLLALRSTALRVDAKRDVRVSLVCRPGPCAGAVELATRGTKPRTLAVKTIAAQAGNVTVVLRLSRADARRVRTRALDVHVRTALANAAGKTVAQRLAARLSAAKVARRR